jgi:hypothetical protein
MFVEHRNTTPSPRLNSVGAGCEPEAALTNMPSRWDSGRGWLLILRYKHVAPLELKTWSLFMPFSSSNRFSGL